MPKWKKDAKEFEVALHHDERRGAMAVIPKPIVDMLGVPDSITFVIETKHIRIHSDKTSDD